MLVVPNLTQSGRGKRDIRSLLPERSKGGQRLYSENDFTKAKLIVALIERGHTISSLARHSLQELRSLLVVKNGEDSESDRMFTSLETKKLVQHLVNFNIDQVVSVYAIPSLEFRGKRIYF